MKIKKVTVYGTGNFGARLAYHIAFNRIDVTVYDKNYGLLEEARTKFRELGSYYQEKFAASRQETEAALANIAYSMDITEAAGNAQLVIEALPEDLRTKKSFYRQLRKTAPEDAIFVTTSKGLDLEKLSTASGRPNKFLNLHFTGNKDLRPTVEIVALKETNKDVLDSVVGFCENIGMEVIMEQPE